MTDTVDFDEFMVAFQHYATAVERAMRGDPDMRGVRVVNAREFDRSMVELMRYAHERLPPQMAYVAIASFVRGIFEGHGLVSRGDPS